jgi:2-(1,2-epoxy-1,2-dihydrophenyl)acetyl-CoA isomerase
LAEPVPFLSGLLLFFYSQLIIDFVMDFKTILYTVENGVATIALNRPDVYNAFNNELSYELQDAFKAAEKDENARVLVLTGMGKAFCSGQDLRDREPGKEIDFRASLEKRYNPIIRAIRNMPKPVICRLNGVAAGAGCSLALACDLIIASADASMIEVFVNIGLVLDSGSSYFLPRLVGYHKAFEWSTLGTKISAAEAHQLGIITKVVPAEELDAAVLEYASKYAVAPTKAIALMKKMLNKGMNQDLDSMLEYEKYCQTIAGASQDFKEGTTAFLEKRKPAFKGK